MSDTLEHPMGGVRPRLVLVEPTRKEPYQDDCRQVLLATKTLSKCRYQCPADSVKDAIELSGWKVRVMAIHRLEVWDKRRRVLWVKDLAPQSLAISLGHLRLHDLQNRSVQAVSEAQQWAEEYLLPRWLLMRLHTAYCGPLQQKEKAIAEWARVPEELVRRRLQHFGIVEPKPRRIE